MLTKDRLYRAPARIFIAVEEHGDEQRRGLPAANMKQRRSRQVSPEVRAGTPKSMSGK
jgi:hypothetical protein